MDPERSKHYAAAILNFGPGIAGRHLCRHLLCPTHLQYPVYPDTGYPPLHVQSLLLTPEGGYSPFSFNHDLLPNGGVYFPLHVPSLLPTHKGREFPLLPGQCVFLPCSILTPLMSTCGTPYGLHHRFFFTNDPSPGFLHPFHVQFAV